MEFAEKENINFGFKVPKNVSETENEQGPEVLKGDNYKVGNVEFPYESVLMAPRCARMYHRD